ncbi:MAG: ABC transporter ATP-binding protein [Actinomycetota bacterium]|nr:ABC transporter ATP-binding protein [Actinomycetota bacterium]
MSDVAIACERVWKSYRIYHQRSHTLKEKLLSRRNRYDEFWALKGIDLEVERGTTTGIIGTNGSGKSTLLKTMARILTPNRGSVSVTGTMASLLELGIGFHPELTGRENVFLSGSLLGRNHREIAARYDEIVDFAGIEDFMDTAVKNYSTGMYARLAFSVAVSVDPEILLIDEVLSVGDESFQIRCFDRMAEFRSKGHTIVLVTHSLEAVRNLCARALWIEKGGVKTDGEPLDVVADYLLEVHTKAGEGATTEPIIVGSGERFGSGEVVVSDLAFLDGDGHPAAGVRTGEPMTIRFSYKVERAVKELSFTFAVYRADSLAYVFGQNSRLAGLEVPTTGDGTVEIHIPRVPLLPAKHLLSLALHDNTVHRFYDWHERRYSFMVLDNPSLGPLGGLVHVPDEWRWSGATASVLSTG